MTSRRRAPDFHDEYRLLAAAAVDGRLDADSAAALEAHLATCERCRADQAAMLADHALLAEPAKATWPREEVRSSVLAAASAPRVPRTSDRPRSLVPLLAAAVLVAALGAVAIGFGSLGPNRSPGPSSDASRPSVHEIMPSLSPGLPPEPTNAVATPIPISTSLIPRVGERIPIWPSPPATFPANTPFYLGQGYCFDSTDVNAEQTARDPGTAVDFIIDGKIQVALQELFVPGEGVCVVGTGWVVNVPEGLPAGTHHLEAHWYLSGAVDQVRVADVQFE